VERFVYFRTEFYFGAIGLLMFFTGFGTGAGVVLVGLALASTAGFSAWRKWERMENEARGREARAMQAVSVRPSDRLRPRWTATSTRSGLIDDLSATARRVAEVLSAVGDSSYEDIADELDLDSVRVLAALRQLSDAGIVTRERGAVYTLISIGRHPSSLAPRASARASGSREGPDLSEDATRALAVIASTDGARFESISNELGFELARVSDAVKELEAVEMAQRQRGGTYRATNAGLELYRDGLAGTSTKPVPRETRVVARPSPSRSREDEVAFAQAGPISSGHIGTARSQLLFVHECAAHRRSILQRMRQSGFGRPCAHLTPP
jgi:DNA-binding MarR family transcriptional regulator